MVRTPDLPKLTMKQLKYLSRLLVLGIALIGNAHGQSGDAPLLLHLKPAANAFPIAGYSNIKVETFRKLVIGAFEDSQFVLTGTSKAKEKHEETHYKFSYSVLVDEKPYNIEMVVKVNENLDKNKRCANCFLRQTFFPEFFTMTKLPWKVQYEIGSRVFPAIDQAFAKIRTNGQTHISAGFDFNYKNQWNGERNLLDNSFVDIGASELKAAIIDAYQAAGFVFVNEQIKGSTGSVLDLVFSFPVDGEQGGGVVYKIWFASRLTPNGACYTCETKESYDPYQQLPPAGISGASSRLTLEARFAAARTLAFEKFKAATERYLRPRSVFIVPPKPAPLGSPRPRPVPPVVT